MENDSIQKKDSISLPSIGSRFPRFFIVTKALILPFSMAIFPTLFLYGNNATILLLPSLLKLVVLNAILAIVLYFLIYLLLRYKPIKAANSATVFLFFFNTYGIVFTLLLRKDIIRIEHYTLFPLYVLLAIYSSWLVTKTKESSSILFWNVGAIIFGILLVINVIKIIPSEITKEKNLHEPITTVETISPLVNKNSPDIYYIILDEFSGFEPMRNYWHYQGVDEFKQFLVDKGFFVAENSHASTIDTLHELATRLNYQEFPVEKGLRNDWMNAIANNKAMKYIKSQGYSTVTFDETLLAYETFPTVVADYSYSVNESFSSGTIIFDEFGTLIADNTMLRAFSKFYRINNPIDLQHRNMIFNTIDKLANITEVPSPKFIFVHLLFPHFPFMFTENGNLVDPQYYHNWHYYLGNYKYSIQLAKKMVDNIISNANPSQPPIIILQSDHGARNHKTGGSDTETLDGFPDEYKTSILFALYIPGYDYSPLAQDIDPINTLPIVFNHLFTADIPLR